LKVRSCFLITGGIISLERTVVRVCEKRKGGKKTKKKGEGRVHEFWVLALQRLNMKQKEGKIGVVGEGTLK